MNDYNSVWKLNIRKSGGYMMLVLLLVFLLSASFAISTPASPTTITYSKNSTHTSALINRSIDLKGTITTINLDASQQDYKWKAYVGNVSGTLSLSDANNKAIYDWSLGAAAGEVYVSRSSTINWATVNCVDTASIIAEQTAVSMPAGSRDNITNTFPYTTHVGFSVGTTPITGCRSTATYINGLNQTMGSGATFQEVLLRDTGSGNMIYTSIINASAVGYDGASRYDFQMIVAENESATTPTTYFFWVELG